MLMTATTWGITGPQFLWAHGALCAAATVAVLLRWLALLGPREPAGAELADLGLYELAALGDGPDLAITSAASQLHRDSDIRVGAGDGLEPLGELPEDADPLERAVFEVVRGEPGISAVDMRAQVLESEAVQSMTAQLTRDGLLIDRDLATALARRILLFGGLLTLLGIARIVAGAIGGRPVTGLVVMAVVVAVATIWATGRVPMATSRGRARLQCWRDAHDDLRRSPVGGECALAAALFGARAAEPASMRHAPRVRVRDRCAGQGGGRVAKVFHANTFATWPGPRPRIRSWSPSERFESCWAAGAPPVRLNGPCPALVSSCASCATATFASSGSPTRRASSAIASCWSRSRCSSSISPAARRTSASCWPPTACR